MKKIKSKDLKVGEIYYDSYSMKLRFKFLYNRDGRIYFLPLADNHGYDTESDGTVSFSVKLTNYWYQEKINMNHFEPINIDDILPICFDAGEKKFRINLANVNNASTGNNWKYEPFMQLYDTESEAIAARLNIYEAIMECNKYK